MMPKAKEMVYYKGVEIGQLSRHELIEAFIFLAKRTLRLEAKANDLHDAKFVAECLELSESLEIKDNG